MLDTIAECADKSDWQHKAAMSNTLRGLFDYLVTVDAEALEACLTPYLTIEDAPWPGPSEKGDGG